jgi:hypothetical protein
MLADVGRLLGYWVTPEAQLGVLFPQLRGETPGLANGQHYAAALQVLAAAVSSMPPARLDVPLVSQLASVLAQPSLAEDDPPSLRPALAAAVWNALCVGVCGMRTAAAAALPPLVPAGGRRLSRAFSISEAAMRIDDDAAHGDGGASVFTGHRYAKHPGEYVTHLNAAGAGGTALSRTYPPEAVDGLLLALLHVQVRRCAHDLLIVLLIIVV